MSSKKMKLRMERSKLHPMQKTIEGLVMRKLSTLNQLKKLLLKRNRLPLKKKKNQAKNVNICMLKVKMRVQNVLQLSKEKETTVANINLKLLKKSSSFINQSFHYYILTGSGLLNINLRKIESLI